MGKFKFVGFQENVEIPKGYELLEVSETIFSSQGRDELFILVGTPSGLSRWFYQVDQLDSRPGGKVFFQDQLKNKLEGRCTAITMGREVSLLADSFGQVFLKVSSTGGKSQVDISFAILTDRREEMGSLYLSFINQLKIQMLP